MTAGCVLNSESEWLFSAAPCSMFCSSAKVKPRVLYVILKVSHFQQFSHPLYSSACNSGHFVRRWFFVLRNY